MHHYFKCSNPACEAPLADIVVTCPGDDMVWDFIVECPHCGDKSYKQTVKGIFSIGASPESEPFTRVVDYDMDNPKYVLVKTKQIRPFRPHLIIK